MDERYDLMRSTRDKRYVYIRNYNPRKIYGQHIQYAWQSPPTPVWQRLYEERKLEPPQTTFWQTKPPEELYDIHADRSEVHNLASFARAQSHARALPRRRGSRLFRPVRRHC